MRDDDDTTLVLLDRLRERIDGRHIQMVRRLVEQEDMGVLHRELRKHDTVAQAVRELLDGRGLVRARKTEATELCAPCLDVLLGELLVVEPLQVLDRREVVRRLVRRVLRVLGELQASVPRDRALAWLQRTGNEVEQC